MSLAILSAEIRHEHDTVNARQRARQVARLLGFDSQDQTRIATAVSEIARNAFNYARGGRIEYMVEGRTRPQLFVIKVTDHGPGIRNLSAILEGRYESQTGMGLGIIGSRRLMDRFHIDSTPGAGTTVVLTKLLPKRAPLITETDLARIAGDLARERPQDPLQELQFQNQELLRALEEIRARQAELTRVNRELEDTNRGVVALYAELDEKADHLRRADELKSKFLSNMSHEFRSPLNSILALSGLLRDRSDGPLTADQEQQVGYIRKAAQDLLELVNDLLDLAKVEAGKLEARPIEFEVSNLFAALRGMLRPLLLNQSVDLVFEDAGDIPPLFTDEGKISQILRNFISNALKFTERGEVRVSARLTGENDDLPVGFRHRNRHCAGRSGPDLPGFRATGSSHPAQSERDRPRAPALEKARHISRGLGRSRKPAGPRVHVHVESSPALSGSFPYRELLRNRRSGLVIRPAGQSFSLKTIRRRSSPTGAISGIPGFR